MGWGLNLLCTMGGQTPQKPPAVGYRAPGSVGTMKEVLALLLLVCHSRDFNLIISRIKLKSGKSRVRTSGNLFGNIYRNPKKKVSDNFKN
jgi:hypothetical protein